MMIDKILKIRRYLLEQIADVSVEQLNKIPEGFNNNMIWNMGHLIVAQQGLCYMRANQSPVISKEFLAAFTTNTKPDREFTAEEIAEVKALFTSTIEQFASDYSKAIFTDYTPSPNISRVYGIDLNTVDDAIEFITYHEGYHIGVVMTMRKLVA